MAILTGFKVNGVLSAVLCACALESLRGLCLTHTGSPDSSCNPFIKIKSPVKGSPSSLSIQPDNKHEGCEEA